ncbi:MAG: hypothetical protein JKY31_12675, partial [Rhodobacteraceae bacterium]|nr:hypothetical protein [Paracoccaceae bacterium]
LVAMATKDYIRRHDHFIEQGACTYLTTGDVETVAELAKTFIGQDVKWQKAEMAGQND